MHLPHEQVTFIRLKRALLRQICAATVRQFGESNLENPYKQTLHKRVREIWDKNTDLIDEFFLVFLFALVNKLILLNS